MILKNIRQDVPCCLLIQDTWSSKGRPLLLSLLRHYSLNGYAVHYFKYDSILHGEDVSSFNFASIQMKQPFGMDSKDLVEVLQEWESENITGDKIIIAVDSLSPILLNTSIGALCRAITKLYQSKGIHFLGLVHGDSHDEQTMKLLRHSCTCHLSVSRQDKKIVCQGVWRKSSGKIVDSEETYEVNENSELINIQNFIHIPAGKVELAPSAMVPKSTFRLELDASEEKARSQVTLPYMRKQTEKQSPGKILYEAENADWEDEDPDDDLEI